MEKIKALYKKYEEIIIYLIVGVLTTIVSWGACFVAKFFLDSNDSIQNFLINTISWVVGVVFAYPLNKIWVFKSKNKHIIKEFLGFAGSRVSTWILDVIIMWFFVNLLSFKVPLMNLLAKLGIVFNDIAKEDKIYYWFVKIFISAVLVTIANYVFSKFLIFGKKKGEKNKKANKEEKENNDSESNIENIEKDN